MIYFQILEDEHGESAKEKPTQFGLFTLRSDTGRLSGRLVQKITVTPEVRTMATSPIAFPELLGCNFFIDEPNRSTRMVVIVIVVS